MRGPRPLCPASAFFCATGRRLLRSTSAPKQTFRKGLMAGRELLGRSAQIRLELASPVIREPGPLDLGESFGVVIENRFAQYFPGPPCRGTRRFRKPQNV